jgi:hypothetical protein
LLESHSRHPKKNPKLISKLSLESISSISLQKKERHVSAERRSRRIRKSRNSAKEQRNLFRPRKMWEAKGRRGSGKARMARRGNQRNQVVLLKSD